MLTRFMLAVGVAAFLVGGFEGHAAIDPVKLCKEKKAKAAGLKGFMLMKAFGKNIKKPNSEKLAMNISKAQSTFTKLFLKPERKGWCDTTGDSDAVEAEVDASVECMVSTITGEACAGFPASGQTTGFPAVREGDTEAVDVADDGSLQIGAELSYVDNGDGTISDLNTGLMWEKKSDDLGLHDKDNAFKWSGNGSEETIWDWLEDVNLEDGTGFAGHSDWRIPNARELQSIISYGWNDPAVDPVFNTGCAGTCTVLECSCVSPNYHWSSTSAIWTTSWAFGVGFNFGDVLGRHYSTLLNVRAVRGP